MTIPQGVTSIGQYAFAYAYYVKTVSIEEGSKLESIGAVAVYYMLYLKEVILPDTVKTIGNLAFGYNQSLVNVYVPLSGTVTSNVT